MSAAYYLTIFSVLSGVFPVLAAWYNYRHLDKILKLTALFFSVSFLLDVVQEITVFAGLRNNLPLIHIYILIGVLFYGAIYYHAFFKQALKKVILILVAIALLIVIFNVIFREGIWDYPSMSNTVLSVMLICFSLAYFYQLLNRQEFVHIEKLGFFWINAGVLFYFSLNIFLFMLLKRMIVNHQVGYYMIHNIVNIIANVLFSAGLLCKPQKTT